MPEPETHRVLAHCILPDDPPLEFVRRADGTVEQLSGPPGVVTELPAVDGPTMTVRLEHNPDGTAWTDLRP